MSVKRVWLDMNSCSFVFCLYIFSVYGCLHSYYPILRTYLYPQDPLNVTACTGDECRCLPSIPPPLNLEDARFMVYEDEER